MIQEWQQLHLLEAKKLVQQLQVYRGKTLKNRY